MVMTVLTAKVDKSKADKLGQVYREKTKRIPPEISSSFLVRNNEDNFSWKIITIWKTMDALQAMRSSGNTPIGVQIFNEVNATPELSVFNVYESTQKPK